MHIGHCFFPNRPWGILFRSCGLQVRSSHYHCQGPPTSCKRISSQAMHQTILTDSAEAPSARKKGNAPGAESGIPEHCTVDPSPFIPLLSAPRPRSRRSVSSGSRSAAASTSSGASSEWSSSAAAAQLDRSIKEIQLHLGQRRVFNGFQNVFRMFAGSFRGEVSWSFSDGL